MLILMKARFLFSFVFVKLKTTVILSEVKGSMTQKRGSTPLSLTIVESSTIVILMKVRFLSSFVFVKLKTTVILSEVEG